MYDLRFRLEKVVTCGNEDCKEDSCKGVVKVLQFRTKDKHVESSTTTPEPLAWTDWQDVPTEPSI